MLIVKLVTVYIQHIKLMYIKKGGTVVQRVEYWTCDQ